MAAADTKKAPSSQEKSVLDQAIERTIEYTPIGADTPLKLTMSMARKYFAKPTKKGHVPSDQDITEFLMMCSARRLNPWTKDAYLTGYDTQDGPVFTIITAYQALAKRAELNPNYDGIEWGIIVKTDNGVEEREGAFRLPEEQLVGAWAKVHRKDRAKPFVVKISRGNYDKGMSLWKSMPDWMLAKCSKAAAMREAFPLDLGGLYVSEEMGEVLPRAIEETERRRSEAKPTTPQTVTAADLTRQPETPTEKAMKSSKEFELELCRCSSVDDVEDARTRWTDNTSSEEAFDRINLACDKRIKAILTAQANLAAGELEPEMLFETHGNAAEA